MTLRIALGDLRHKTVGRHSFFMPLGIGLIGAATRAKLGAENVELRLFDDPDEILDALDHWQPDIVGLAHYCWNSAVSSLVFDYAKQGRPSVLCVAGGPDSPSYHSEEWLPYLESRRSTDFFLVGEGELAFSKLAELVAAGADKRTIERAAIPGCVSLSEDGTVVFGAAPSRSVSLDEFPSPYLSGLMDKWFDGQHAPMIETARGCPYTCGFCVQGGAEWSKVVHHSIDRISAELEYIAERMRKYPGVLLSIADSNFAMYKQDEVVADCLAAIQDKYGWPNAFDVTTGKSNYDRILRIADKLKQRMAVSCSVQSLNKETLVAIRRKNIPADLYQNIQLEISGRGMRSEAELIIPLPEETVQSYYEGLKFVINSGVQFVTTYTSMLLRGTWLASKAAREQYAVTSRFRLIPRQFGEYRGRKCFEIEEVCVSTSTMSFGDYIACRGHALIFAVFSNEHFSILHSLLKETGLSRFDLIHHVWKRIHDGDTLVSDIYQSYLDESQSELFCTPEEVERVLGSPDNYALLLSGVRGDNLMRRYVSTILLRKLPEAFDLAFETLRLLIPQCTQVDDAICDALAWSKATRNISRVFKQKGGVESRQVIELSHDIPAWLRGEMGPDRPLTEYRKNVRISLSPANEKAVDLLQNQRHLHGDDDIYVFSRFLTNWSARDLWLNEHCSSVGD